ncbi:GNAT family N-acetyltransferase [Pseudoclavibacter sp. 13-3]|uniref:GNAT family N-acetyltransferase n=1 Tax=Pseudoclavibacter sp. 13-3 TaxID=2901228 RepID=UPI001E5C954D|nr:GNAT family N-acetyltransferase [Pseudoclavibacter sp. 13-3]MCD7101824.1 GNAT family N-acetyltransferase [Pseudoclavibacter sp. 13-3]
MMSQHQSQRLSGEALETFSPNAQRRLDVSRLQGRVVDQSDEVAIDGWLGAMERGFLDALPPTLRMRRELRSTLVGSRVVGVYDGAADGFGDRIEQGDAAPVAETTDEEAAHRAIPASPAGTAQGWPTDLTLVGGASVDAWAISAVTVAGTHRRRGIARAMIADQLDAAVASGASAAVLTATEGGIYGRFGFGPATRSTTLRFDPRLASWRDDAGGEVTVRLVAPQTLRAEAPQVFDRARAAGDIGRRDVWWQQALRVFSLRLFNHGDSGTTLALRADSTASGRLEGFALYRVFGGEEHGRLVVDEVCAATPAAEAALWRRLLSTDLVGEVTARSRPVDGLLPWLLTDPRAVSPQQTSDSLWVRVLDVCAVLSARSWPRSPAGTRLRLRVGDSSGYADGDYLLRVDEQGVGSAERLAVAAATDASDVTLELDVADLGSLLFGYTSAGILAAAGRVQGVGEDQENALALADDLLATAPAPHLRTPF